MCCSLPVCFFIFKIISHFQVRPNLCKNYHVEQVKLTLWKQRANSIIQLCTETTTIELDRCTYLINTAESDCDISTVCA